MTLMVIDPTAPYTLIELERVKWFLGQIDLTMDPEVGVFIQDAHYAIDGALKRLRKGRA